MQSCSRQCKEKKKKKMEQGPLWNAMRQFIRTPVYKLCSYKPTCDYVLRSLESVIRTAQDDFGKSYQVSWGLAKFRIDLAYSGKPAQEAQMLWKQSLVRSILGFKHGLMSELTSAKHSLGSQGL